MRRGNERSRRRIFHEFQRSQAINTNFDPHGELVKAEAVTNGDQPLAFLDFTDLEPIEVPVKVKGATLYWLVEADGDAAEKFRAANIRGVEFVHHDNDDRTFKNLSGSVTSGHELLSRCLYHASPEGKLARGPDGRPNRKFLVSLQQIKMLRGTMLDALVEKCKEISHLDEQDTLPNLVKQRDRLNRQIAKLEAKDELAKKSKSGGLDGFGSPTD